MQGSSRYQVSENPLPCIHLSLAIILQTSPLGQTVCFIDIGDHLCGFSLWNTH